MLNYLKILVVFLSIYGCTQYIDDNAEQPYFIRHFPPTIFMTKALETSDGSIYALGNGGESRNAGIMVKTNRSGEHQWQYPDGGKFLDFGIVNDSIITATVPSGSVLASTGITQIDQPLGNLLVLGPSGNRISRDAVFSNNIIPEIKTIFNLAGFADDTIAYRPIGIFTNSDRKEVTFLASVRPKVTTASLNYLLIHRINEGGVTEKYLAIPTNDQHLVRTAVYDNKGEMILVGSKSNTTEIYRIDKNLTTIELINSIDIPSLEVDIVSAPNGFILFVNEYQGDGHILAYDQNFSLQWNRENFQNNTIISTGPDNSLLVGYQVQGTTFMIVIKLDLENGLDISNFSFCCGIPRDILNTSSDIILLAELNDLTNLIKANNQGKIEFD